MSFSSHDLQELQAYARRLCPDRSQSEIEVLAQEGVRLALERKPARKGALIARAQSAIASLARQRRWERKRESARKSAARAAAIDNCALEPIRRKQRARVPHLPKGLVRSRVADSGCFYTPIVVGDAPTKELKIMAARLVRELVPIAQGDPASQQLSSVVEKAYRRLFNTGNAHDAWAEVLMEEVGLATQESLAATASEALADRDDAMPNIAQMNMVHRATSRKAAPEAISVRCIRRRGDHVTLEYVVEVDGQRRKFWASGELGNGPPRPSYPRESAAHIVLVNTICRATRLGVKVPDFAVDGELVQFLIERMGFAGGGGTKKLKAKSLTQLVLAPDALAGEIESFGHRHAERLNDVDAARCLERYTALAQRIRNATTPAGKA